MPSTETRLGVHGDPDDSMYHRKASAPRSASTGAGSITFPRDFDILTPSLSMMCARHTTLRYGDLPKGKVFTASSE